MKLSRPLILLGLAALVPLVVLTVALIAWGLRQQQFALQRETETQVRLISTLLDRTLTEHVAVLATVAEAPALRGPADAAVLKPYLDRVRRSRPNWLALLVSDPQGRRLAFSAVDPAAPDRLIDVDSVRSAAETGRPAIGHVLRRPGGAMAFAIRAPVIQDGKVVRLVSAVIEPTDIVDLFSRQQLPMGWRGGVLDHTGRIVVRMGAPQAVVGELATPETLAMRARHSSGFLRATSIEGEAVITAFETLPHWGWSVHAFMPYALYQAPVLRSIRLAAVGAVVAVLLAAAFLALLQLELRRREREGAALAEARRMEALGRMTGGVAHDFNNILMIVQGGAELIRRRLAEPDRIEVLAEGVVSAAQRGQALTRQLLTFARRGTQEPVDFRLQDREPSLTGLIRQSLRTDIEFRAEIPAEAWPIHADPEGLEIALINLAVNARDAMPDGGVLSLTAANVVLRPTRGGDLKLAGDYVAITVKDTGCGIPEERLRHIFEPFYTTKAAGRGTGLGLSQVYGFARQAGGAVTVASRDGEGAQFTLYLPRGEAPSAAAAPGPAAAGPRTTSGRLLLVEDDPDVGQTLEELLAASGYRVVRAADAEAALAAIAGEDGFDVVLSDVMLGGSTSGMGLADEIRRRAPALPVVLMSGYAEGLGQAPPGRPLLMKPFGPDELFAALDRARAEGAAGA